MKNDRPTFVCKICNSTEFSYSERSLFDDRYGYNGEFDLIRCEKCSHETLEHNFKESDISDLYSKYYPRGNFKVKDFAPLRFYGGMKGFFLGEKSSAASWVPRGVSVMDVGCGIGSSVAYYKELGCDAIGIEVDQNVAKIRDAYNLDIRVGHLDAEILKGQKFQYVTLSQVIEHTLDPKDMFKKLNFALETGGHLVLSFPWAQGWGRYVFQKKWIHWHAPYHIHFFSKRSFEQLASEHGFEIVISKSVTHTYWLQYQLIHLILGGTQGVPSAFWNGNSEGKNRFQRIMLRLITLTKKYGLIHLVSRFFDLLNLGDNRIVVLRKL